MAGAGSPECRGCPRPNNRELQKHYGQAGMSVCDDCPARYKQPDQLTYYDKGSHLKRSQGNDNRAHGHNRH